MNKIKPREKHTNADEVFAKVMEDLQKYRDRKAEEKTIEEACKAYTKKKKSGN